MKAQPTIWLLFAASFLFFAGCDTEVAARKRLTAKLATATKEMADLLATVKDKPTGEAARPKIQALMNRVEGWTEQLDAMDSMVGIGDKGILEAHGKWIGEEARRMEELYRIGQIAEAREGLGETWKELSGGAFDPGGIFAPGGKMDRQRLKDAAAIPGMPGMMPGMPPAK